MWKEILMSSAIVFLWACNKPVAKSEQIEFKVSEYSSSIPIGEANVEAYKCASSDWVKNCLTIGGFVSASNTGNDGKVLFSKSLEVGTLKVKKDRYWPHENINPTFYPESFLIPVATLKVRVTRINQHPAGHVLKLVGYIAACSDCTWETKQLIQPNDTIVYLKGAGFHQNQITWTVNNVVTPQSITPLVMVNRFDTTEFLVRY